MLKYENTAKIGDTIRAYDFQPIANRNPDYVEGIVVEVTDERGYKAFKIICTRDIWDGAPTNSKGSRIHQFVYIPMETSHDYDGRVERLS